MTSAGPSARRAVHIKITGAVQGVGFRPFVYRLATELNLTGWVINNTQGVFIEVEGDQTALDLFLERLSKEKPPRAIVHSLHIDQRLPSGFLRFEIRHSDHHGHKSVFVLPDIATCDACLREIFDPHDRRYGYPFTNCTNCGPRFSIIQNLPYDRPQTTMRHFVMCSLCQAEYDQPLDRRFHAQPNACSVCGPQLDFRFSPAAVGLANQTDQPPGPKPDATLRMAVEALRAGLIVAVKGLGGFHLMVDATNAEAVARLRQGKQRYDKPLAVMAPDLALARTLCDIPPEAEMLLRSPEAPIVLLPRQADNPLADNIAPGNPYLGLMLPYTPLHHLLLREFGRAVVATSGNLSDEPICIDNEEAQQRLGHIADAFLLHNRPIERHVDDSVTWLSEGQPRLLRRARGYAPLPVVIPVDAPTILAVGAHLKNTIALNVGRQVFISQHIGDLETAEALVAFERVIADFLRLYEARPVVIAHDLHPDYLSTRWAANEFRSIIDNIETKSWGVTPQAPRPAALEVKSIGVQHHHAHLAACLADNGQTAPALGVIWDGTGYGPDGTIWGGEFLLGDAADFERVAHLRPFRLPGGDAAVKEPRRTALALLWELYGEAALARDDLAPIRAFLPGERRLLGQMLAKSFNAPLTTSAGRLFDGVAALLDLQQTVSFEGQAAMALEFAANQSISDAYPLPFVNIETDYAQSPTVGNLQFAIRNSPLIIDWGPLIEAILADLRRGIPAATISARFHNALVEAIVNTAQRVGQERVALSGGCFQNRLLTKRSAARLRQAGFEVLLHRQVPPNDGGISLGQVAVAAAQVSR